MVATAFSTNTHSYWGLALYDVAKYWEPYLMYVVWAGRFNLAFWLEGYTRSDLYFEPLSVSEERDVVLYDFREDEVLPTLYVLLNHVSREGLEFVCVARTGTVSIFSDNETVSVKCNARSVSLWWPKASLVPCIYTSNFRENIADMDGMNYE